MAPSSAHGLHHSKSWSWYESDNPLDAFVNFTLNAFDSKHETIFFAHNGGRFDSHFVLRSLYKRKLAPKVTMTGLKIYEISVQLNKHTSHLKFHDSWLILQTPLDNLKKTFALDVQEKMFFPYLFCTASNKHLVLPSLPPMVDYTPASMKPEKYDKFVNWYQENQLNTFNLRESLAEYCENDTEILLQV
jgi:hypothetical protein